MAENGIPVAENELENMAPDLSTLFQNAPKIENRGHGDQLPERYDEAILALLTCSSITKAAKKIGISRNTLCMWLTKPEFVQLLKQARKMVFDHAMTRLQGVAGLAIKTLVDAAKSTTRPDLKVKAADLLLCHLLKAAEIANVEQRLAEIEQLVVEQGRVSYGRATFSN